MYVFVCVCVSSHANTQLSSLVDRGVTKGVSKRRTVAGSVRGDVITVRPARTRALRSSWAACAGAELRDWMCCWRCEVCVSGCHRQYLPRL